MAAHAGIMKSDNERETMRLRHDKDYPHNALIWYFQVHTVNDKHTWKSKRKIALWDCINMKYILIFGLNNLTYMLLIHYYCLLVANSYVIVL